MPVDQENMPLQDTPLQDMPLRDMESKGLRLLAWICAGLQVLVWLYLAYYIGQHTNPKGDGMEWVAMSPATMILVATIVPVWRLARNNNGEWLEVAAGLAALGVALNLLLFFQVANEFAG
jgi:hypothetical protein